MSFIAIAGNIGVGKSALTERLAEQLGWAAALEPTSENPYLPDFYSDMNRWSFHSQVFLLAHRLRQHVAFARDGNLLIQDRSVYENAEIFARNLYLRGLMNERDWQTYRMLYETSIALVPTPTLIIYLQASVPTLMERIRGRGRSFEQNIDQNYLADLNRLYDEWAATTTVAPVLRISTDGINFVADAPAIEDVAKQVIALLPAQQLPIYS